MSKTARTDPSEPSIPQTKPAWEQFSLSLLNASRAGVIAMDENGTLVFANGVAERALGLHAGAALAEILPQLSPVVSQTLKDFEYRSGISVQGLDGTSFLAKVSPILVGGRSVGVLCVFEDATELEAITQQLLSVQQLSRELDAIIDSSSDGLWVCDSRGVVVRINPASERINAIRASDVIGHAMDELLQDGLIDRSVTMEVLKTGERATLIQQTRAGRKLMVTGSPVLDEAGNVTRVVINERDITEIDRLREELEQQEAISDEIRKQLRHMQIEEVESRAIVARSPSMTAVLKQALKVSGVDSNVLILGESGTGKGLIADLIHKHSARAANPMIKINCGAIPENLVESELFGYERGAFTGAEKSGKVGLVELAHKGILFLDEIAELPLASQVKLLRFLEDGRATRIGGTVSRKLDVRIIAATNRDLEAMVAERQFRRDLYYRLNVIPIVIAPLRERREDILPLIHHFLEHFGARTGSAKSVTGAALDALQSYTYPGNVRELMNLCERLVVMSEGPRIDLPDLPAPIARRSSRAFSSQDHSLQGGSLQEMLDAYEKAILTQALTLHKAQQAIAATLGVNQSTIARKLKKHGLFASR